jgi:Tfp pilus assembly protein PilV
MVAVMVVLVTTTTACIAVCTAARVPVAARVCALVAAHAAPSDQMFCSTKAQAGAGIFPRLWDFSSLGLGGRARCVPADGFTLVEIVMAIGLFTFALLGVVFMLGNGLRSSSDTQRDSALASVVSSSVSLVRAQPTNATLATNYFSLQGAMLPNASNAAYQVVLKSVGSGGGPTTLDLWTATVTGPVPATNVAGNFLFSRIKP